MGQATSAAFGGANSATHGLLRVMARKPRSLLPDGYFHVWTHAVAGEVLFHDDTDRRFFLGLLDSAAARYRLEVLSFVLLDNHVHLLLRTETRALSKAMWSVNWRFADRHNGRHGRRGVLFDGRFNAKSLGDERYLLTVLRYIALNPVEAAMCRRPELHRWSAHRALIGEMARPAFLNADRALAFFGRHPARARAAYSAFVAGSDPPMHDLVRLRVDGVPAARPRLAALVRDDSDEKVRIAADRYGYTHAEIASVTGLSETAVRRRLARARAATPQVAEVAWPVPSGRRTAP